jgi:hypothetical protein
VTQGLVKFILSSAPLAELMIHVIPNQGTLQQFTPIEISNLQQHWASVSKPDQMQLSGNPGVFISFADQNGLGGTKFWTVQNANAYVLTYAATDYNTWKSNLQTVMSIIKSFQISPGASSFSQQPSGPTEGNSLPPGLQPPLLPQNSGPHF